MEHCLFGGELGDWGKHTAGVTGEEDDVGGVVGGEAGDLSVGDVFDGVCASCVFCECGVVVVCLAGFGVKDNVLEDGAEADGIENVGLFLGGKVDAFGVALVLRQSLRS